MRNEIEYSRAIISTPKRMMTLLVIMGMTMLLGFYTIFVKEPPADRDAGLIDLTDPIYVDDSSSNDAQSELPSNRDSGAMGAQRTLVGQVMRIWEGDTFLIGNTAIQISVLDCASTKTAFGKQAAQFTSDLVNGQTLTCKVEGRRLANLEIAACAFSDGRDFGQTVLAAGMCAYAPW